jgi:uncharacterized membrane protein
MTQTAFAILGISMGVIYYFLMKNSIKDPYKNCSFVSNKTTDILAFMAGIVLLYYGFVKYKDNVLVALGLAIITEHILQISYKF